MIESNSQNEVTTLGSHQTSRNDNSDGPPPYPRPRDKHPSVSPEPLLAKFKHYSSDNVVFRFAVGDIETGTGWVAQLSVHALNVPHLMKNGLGCLEDHVDKEANHITWNAKKSQSSAPGCFKWSACRRYTLRMKSGRFGGSPGWYAELTVYALNELPLSTFRLANLTSDTCTLAGAWQGRNVVYFYSENEPWRSFNAIYDDMPLGAPWPWPKPKDQEAEESI